MCTNIRQSSHANSVLLPNARHLAEAPDLTGLDLTDLAWNQHEEEIRLGISAGQRLRKLRAEWADRLKPSAWSSDITNLREDLEKLGPKLWRFLSPRWREANPLMVNTSRLLTTIPRWCFRPSSASRLLRNSLTKVLRSSARNRICKLCPQHRL